MRYCWPNPQLPMLAVWLPPYWKLHVIGRASYLVEVVEMWRVSMIFTCVRANTWSVRVCKDNWRRSRTVQDGCHTIQDGWRLLIRQPLLLLWHAIMKWVDWYSKWDVKFYNWHRGVLVYDVYCAAKCYHFHCVFTKSEMIFVQKKFYG